MTKSLRYSWVILLGLGMAPVLFLAIRHWGQFWYFVLLIAGLIYCIGHRPRVTSQDLLPLLTLAAPFLAVLVAQALRGDLLMRSFDSPSRILCAIPVYFLIRDMFASGELKSARVLNTLAWASSLALLLLPFFLDDARTLFYGGRIATARADTNTLGSYVGIFLIIVLSGSWRVLQDVFQRSLTRARAVTLVLYAASLAVGLDTLLQTQSRGAWIGFTCVLVMTGTLLMKVEQKTRWKPALCVSVLLTLLIAGTVSDQQLERVKSIPTEALSWAQTGQQETSGGIRLSMVSLSLDLFMEKPISGYGEKGYAKRATEEDFALVYGKHTINDMSQAGPHNGILDQALENGMFGLAASLILCLAPIVLLLIGFKKEKRDATVIDATLKILGVAFFLQILLLQFTINPYGLRMLASFNAVMLALFLAFNVSQKTKSAAS